MLKWSGFMLNGSADGKNDRVADKKVLQTG